MRQIGWMWGTAALLALAAGVFSGCARGPVGNAARPSDNALRSGASQQPSWNASAAPGTDRLFVMRASETTAGRDILHAVDIADGADTPLWTAPAGYDARMLCADGTRMAVALSKRGASNVASRFTTETSTFNAWGVHVDQLVVVLRADGSITTGSVPASSTGVVNSGAFVEDRLVLGMSGPVLHYESFQAPLVMDERGRMGNVTVNSSGPPEERLQYVIQLDSGDVVAGFFGGSGPVPSARQRVLPCQLSGARLEAGAAGVPRSWTASSRFDIQPVSGPGGLVLFGRIAEKRPDSPYSLVRASLYDDTSTVIAKYAWPAGGPPWGQRAVALLADGGYLLAVGRLYPTDGQTYVAGERLWMWDLRRLDSKSGVLATAPVTTLREWPVEYAGEPVYRGAAMPVPVRQDTWVYVERFGG